MASDQVDYRSRVIYIRDAKSLPLDDREELHLGAAIKTALANYRMGEAPVIIGNSIELVGIDAIRAAEAHDGFPRE